jgi:hypothetical protein
MIFRDDQIFHPDAQTRIAKRAAPPDHIITIKCSHAGIVSQPEEVAKFITQAADDSAAPSPSS